MSRLAFAMHMPPLAINERDNELRRLQVDMDHHDQCRRAFLQAPSPRLGKALQQLEAAISRRQAMLRKKGWL